MIARFFTWWRRTLAETLPASWTRSRGSDASVLEIDITRSEILFRHRAGEVIDELGKIERGSIRGSQQTSASHGAQREAVRALIHGLRPERTRCRINADGSLTLRKTVRLPLAAEENLRQVLAFEMERHTPFHADDVYFSFTPTSRDQKQRRLEVDLLVVQKPVVDEALELIKDWEPRFSPDDRPDDGPELAFAPRNYRAPTSAVLNRVLVVLNVLALLAVGLIPLYQQERYIDALKDRAERARAAAMASVEVQDRIRALEARRALFHEAKAGPSTVELIDELTRLMPDGTWLHRLDIKNGEIQFQGLSDAASSLIGVVESSPVFHEARFGSPITRDARSGKERFHISARLENSRQGVARGAAGEDSRS